MFSTLSDEIISKIEQTTGLYNRLVLIVAPAGGGKTYALHEVKRRIGVPLINVNLELSLRMLELTERQRALHVPRLLDEIIRQNDKKILLLGNIEILFHVSLKQDPIRLLQGISRNRTIVASLSCRIEKDYLFYAAPDHPEYLRYQVRDFLMVSPEPQA